MLELSAPEIETNKQEVRVSEIHHYRRTRIYKERKRECEREIYLRNILQQRGGLLTSHGKCRRSSEQRDGLHESSLKLVFIGARSISLATLSPNNICFMF